MAIAVFPTTMNGTRPQWTARAVIRSARQRQTTARHAACRWSKCSLEIALDGDVKTAGVTIALVILPCVAASFGVKALAVVSSVGATLMPRVAAACELLVALAAFAPQ